jgi:hypothetical protein
VLHFAHRVKVSFLVDASLGIVRIVPWKVRMIKTEKIGMEYGWVLGGAGVWRANML